MKGKKFEEERLNAFQGLRWFQHGYTKTRNVYLKEEKNGKE